MTPDAPNFGEDMVTAARVLAALGMVTAFGHVSVRHADHVLITPAIDLAEATPDTLVGIPLDARTLPAGAPGEAWVHLAVYRARPDVDAVARAIPESAFAAGSVTSRIPPLHGQGAMLGEAVPVHDDARLMRSAAIAEAAVRTLGKADALVLRGNGAVTTGCSPGHAVARMWLLDVTCRLHLAARQAGASRPLTPDEIASWRAAAPPLLDRLWAHLRRTTES
ncbi:decarboxylase protein [Streptomyces bingchenggensis BCW-1]|uniref:Decarboxylase protein n=1 Tax=Streptomyces bingchenggensis (strain BCW-1) TaxID=749414 RepID=D7CDY3_STRBB|nr:MULTISPECIES: class II aldolase/adducin family protein [Streptomyces]ADI04648.1 decarboxylase protein [Streptomyces bingchenggensis BCW-1]